MKRLMILFLFFLHSMNTEAAAQKTIPILMYHSIDTFTGSGLRDLYVSPQMFERQMQYLKENGYTLLTFERWEEVNQVQKPVFVTFDDGYRSVQNAYDILKALQDDTFRPATTIFTIADFINRPNRLSQLELLDMSDSGMFSIQSHTATHPDLRSITNYEYELKGAKEKLEAVTGKSIIALSYPYGFFDDKVIAETKKYYTFAVTVRQGLFTNSGDPDQLYRLPRVFVTYDMTLEQFAKAIP